MLPLNAQEHKFCYISGTKTIQLAWIWQPQCILEEIYGKEEIISCFFGPRMNFRITGTSKFKIDYCKEIQTFSNLLPHSLPQFEIIFIKKTHCVHPLLSSVNNYRTASGAWNNYLWFSLNLPLSGKNRLSEFSHQSSIPASIWIWINIPHVLSSFKF